MKGIHHIPRIVFKIWSTANSSDHPGVKPPPFQPGCALPCWRHTRVPQNTTFKTYAKCTTQCIPCVHFLQHLKSHLLQSWHQLPPCTGTCCTQPVP